MAFFVQMIRERAPGLLTVVGDVPHLIHARNYDMELAKADITKLRKGIQAVRSYEIELSGLDDPESYELLAKTTMFRQEAESATQEAITALDTATSAIILVQQYFGDMETRPSELLSGLYDFIQPLTGLP